MQSFHSKGFKARRWPDTSLALRVVILLVCDLDAYTHDEVSSYLQYIQDHV